ncbi:MAG: TolC family protein [Salinivirgaceae bacterium]|jgi:outer membrane protein|nr:TolC family protein [Bacteroidales bacterium]
MRRTIKKITTTILCSVALVATSIGQEQIEDIMIFSLDSAVSYSIEHNKQLVNSKYAIEKSGMQVKEAISAGLPQIQASLDYQNFLGASAIINFGPIPAKIPFNPTSNFQTTVSQLLFNGNYFVGIQLSKLAKEITEQVYEKDELNVKEQTIRAYYMVLVSEQVLKTMQSNRENIEDIYKKTSNMANIGVIEQIEAKKLSVMITTVDNAIKSTERQTELAYNLLRLQLGLGSDQKIKLEDTLEDLVDRFINNNESKQEFNLSANLDYKLVELQTEIAQKNVNMQRANFLPTLAAFYSYTEKIKKPEFDISPKNILGVTLNIPIFSGGQRYMKLSQAKVDLYSAENTLTLLQDQLTIQERQLNYTYQNLLEQYEYQKTNVEIAKEVLENVTLKHEQGMISSLELTNANSEYLKAETSYTGVLLELLNAELALRKLNSNL